MSWWRRFVCAFTWHTWMFDGITGLHARYRCDFCRSERYRSFFGG